MRNHIDLKDIEDDDQQTKLMYDVSGHAPVFRTIALIILAELIVACGIFITILINY